MHRHAGIAPALRTPRAAADGPWTAPLTVVGVLLAWGAWGALAAPRGLPAAAGAPSPLALALAARLAGWCAEAAFYRMVWCAAGARLPGPRLIAAIAACSLCDLVAGMLSTSPGWPGWPWDAMLAGRAAASGDGALALASAGFGLLAVARIVGTAGAQAGALGRPLAAPLALTLASWSATRLALTLVAALLRGRSPW